MRQQIFEAGFQSWRMEWRKDQIEARATEFDATWKNPSLWKVPVYGKLHVITLLHATSPSSSAPDGSPSPPFYNASGPGQSHLATFGGLP